MTKHEKQNSLNENIEDNTSIESSQEKEENIELLKEELKKLNDKFLRKVAEFENYKKRNESEISSYIKYASESLIKKLLPVLDDFNRSKESIEKGETKDFETLKEGLLLIYDKFFNVLSSEGLKEIEVEGKEFDVNLCDALMQEPRSDVAPNIVTKVVEKGYFLKDKVLRHSKVLVSAPPIENNNVEENI